ncbi:hypothetical protein F2P79_000980 [Pimephales promelas]|nr:hypothetical protein F2P79_012565 [Pimephales promelas]KAG1952116.1 hypothetical protein F2P79_010100 [Pimephales promelas]KAG1963278.1 hypothetical protein F2P79_003768 [Pimephales promelas]KAG1973732.1 hypothetical protein F2P79_000980 [Pimephales promelas]
MGTNKNNHGLKSLPITCPQHYKATRREHRSFQNPAADYLVRFLKVPSTTRFFTKVGSAQPFLLCETTALNFTVSDWIQLIHSYPATVFHLLNVFDSSTAVLLQSQSEQNSTMIPDFLDCFEIKFFKSNKE